MNSFFNIGLICGFFLCCACATSPTEKGAEDMIETQPIQESALEAQFESEQMDAPRLKAFEARAQQKLQDLADYIKILEDPTLDSTFRQQAMRQALALFEHETGPMLQGFYDEELQASKYSIQDIQVARPLQSTGTERYEGVLSFKSNMTTSQGASVITPKEAVIVLKKVEKEFGDERKLIWEVLLGKIQ